MPLSKPGRIVFGHPLIGSVLGLAAAVAVTPNTWKASTDVVAYAGYAAQTTAGLVPYRDFFVEYPPGVLAAILPPAVAGTKQGPYTVAFAIEMLALMVAVLVVMTRALARLGIGRAGHLAALAPFALSPVLLGPLVTGRYDVLPALAVICALLCLTHGREPAAAALLGLGAATKVYPVVLLPLVLIVAARAGGGRRVVRSLVAFAVAVAAVAAPFAILAPHGLVDSLRYQLVRPLQFETLGAIAALVAHQWVGLSVGTVVGYDTFGLGGTRGAALAWAQSVLLAAVLVWILARTVRIADRGRRGWLCAAATLAAIVTLGRALSPQYLIWLLPVVPLVGGAAGGLAAGALTLAAVLTRLYWLAPNPGNIDSHAILLLAARNVCLVAVLATLLVALKREPDRADALPGGPS